MLDFAEERGSKGWIQHWPRPRKVGDIVEIKNSVDAGDVEVYVRNE